ncbi:hypothetical protein Ancab_032514 [Ancistrocladus abbreviatus]
MVERSASAPPGLSSHLFSGQSLTIEDYDKLIATLSKHVAETTQIHSGHGRVVSSSNSSTIDGGNNNRDGAAVSFLKLLDDLSYHKDSHLKHEDLFKNEFKRFGVQTTSQIEPILRQIEDVTSRDAGRYKELLALVDELRYVLSSYSRGRLAQSNSTRPRSLMPGSSSSKLTDIGDDHNRLQGTSIFKDFLQKYRSLEPKAQQCLLRFSVFPEGVVIKRRTLMHWWLGEELIEVPADKNLEDVGAPILDTFMEMGFLEPVVENGKVTNRCKMPNYIHESIVARAREEKVFDVDDENGELVLKFGQLKTSLINNRSSIGHLKSLAPDELAKIQTLFNVSQAKLNIRLEWFSKMKDVRVLHLGRWGGEATQHIEVEGTKFLEGLHQMKELRLLSLRWISRISELPDSISSLGHLRILDLRACHNLEKISSKIRFLKQLTYLDISNCYLLDHLPKKITSLSALQVLKGFVVVDHIKDEEACEFRDLSKLENLRKLKISTRRMTFPTSDDLKALGKFNQLCKLTIEWGGIQHKVLKKFERDGSSGDRNESFTELNPAESRRPFNFKNVGQLLMRNQKREEMDIWKAPDKMFEVALPLPKKLEKLDLRSVPQSAARRLLMPSSLNNLKKLYIRGGDVHDIGQGNKEWQKAKKLEIVRLKYLTNLHMDWRQFRSSFPNVTYLEIVQCPNLAFFPCSNQGGVWTKSNY